jgi:dynein heavy chain
MALVNSMYQYSLSAFLDVFVLSLKKSLPDSVLMKRLRNIMDTLTFNVYNYGCTGERPLPPAGDARCPGAQRGGYQKT